MSERRYKVGILGATGAVGQRFVQLLEGHPLFEVAKLGASERSAGKSYEEAVTWRMTTDLPGDVAGLPVMLCEPEHFEGVDLVFSGLDSSVAGEVESAFEISGFSVISNSKNHRMDEGVPLLVADVNPEQADLVKGKKGFIVTNPNCSTVGLVTALKPLLPLGVEKVMVTTMQATSGAGFPGGEPLDITGNVIPYIDDEEPKLEEEPEKILGEKFVISATCNRVPVQDGHLEVVSVKFKEKPSLEAVKEAFEGFGPVIYTEESDRPQPLLDRDAEKGMAVTVGRLRECPVLDYKFHLLVHNTIRGAAGIAILNAELLVKKDLI